MQEGGASCPFRFADRISKHPRSSAAVFFQEIFWVIVGAVRGLAEVARTLPDQTRGLAHESLCGVAGSKSLGSYLSKYVR